MVLNQAQLLAGVRHVVHHYANLISSGTMKLSDRHRGSRLRAPVSTHVGEAFLFNCRKMFEFFRYPQFAGKNPSGDDLGASLYLSHVSPALVFSLATWDAWHVRMNKIAMPRHRGKVTRQSPPSSPSSKLPGDRCWAI